jgi:glucose-6-phosphate 1-dehydrogenase
MCRRLLPMRRLKLLVDNWRWKGVPFYMRTGKRMPKKISEISIHFKEVPFMMFQSAAQQLSNNVLALRIQPDEGISMRFEVKDPRQLPPHPHRWIWISATMPLLVRPIPTPTPACL